MEDQLEYAAPNLKLRDFVDPDQASFLAAYSIELSPEITERLARALARAVELIVPAIRDLRMITLIFGKPPAYVIHVGTGTDIYYADMSQTRLRRQQTNASVCMRNGSRVCLRFPSTRRLSSSSKNWCMSG